MLENGHPDEEWKQPDRDRDARSRSNRSQVRREREPGETCHGEEQKEVVREGADDNGPGEDRGSRERRGRGEAVEGHREEERDERVQLVRSELAAVSDELAP